MFFLFLRFTVGFVRPTVSFLRQSMVAFALFSHLIFGVSSVPADEGPMLEVTADTAPIQVTKNGTPQTLGTVTKGTRLWPFETMGEHYLVLVPGTQTKGWIHDRLAGPIVLSDRDQQRLEEAESTFSEATAAFDEGRFAEALKSSEAALKEFVRLFGELHTLTGNALNQTGLCHMNLEDYEAAEPLLQRALKVRLTLYGEADEFTGYSIANLADMYERNGEDQKSAEKYRQLLKIRERELGADHETTIEVVESLGHVLAVPGSYPEADRLLRRALRVRERLNPEDNEQTAWVLHNLGYVCDESGKNSEALNHIQRSFDIRTRLLGESHEDTTLTLNNLASLHLELSDYDKAKAAYEQLAAIYTRLHGEQYAETADALENLGYVAERQKRFADSEAIHRRVLKIRETLFGPEHSDIAYSYDSLGTLYEAMHEFSKAESMYRRSLEIREQTLDENDPLIAHSLGALGWIQVELGDYMQAERELQRALRIRETVEENHPDTAVVLANLGTVYSSIGEYSGAETFYRRAEKVSTAVYGKDHIETVHARHGLGNVYGDIGEYAQAESLLKNALEVTERELGPDNESTGNILTSLGWLYERKGDFTAAEPYYRRAYEVTLRTVGEDHPTTALARLNLSINHRETGDYAKAEELLQQALTGFRTTYGPDHFNVGESLRYLGLLYLTSGDYVRAEETLGQSLSIFQRTLTDSHPFVATVQQLLSVTHAALGDFRKATQFREQSRRSVRRHMAKTLPGLSQKSQQKYLAANFRPDFVAALSLGLHQKDDPRTATLSAGWLLNGKGVAQEVLAEAALLSTAEAVPLVRRLRQVRDEISKLAIQRTGQDESKRREALAILETEQQRLQQQIGEHGLGLNKADPWVSASSVRGQLPFDSVFVNIARFDVAQVTSLKKDREPARYVAWVIPAAGAGEIHLVDLGPAQPIDQKVAAIRAQIQKTLNDLPESDEAALETALQKSLNEISDLVLRPLEASLGDVVEVILSPDGSLWNLPWNALLMSDGRYLVEAFRTRYVLSGRELVASIPERAAISEPVLFADPDFDLSPDGVQAAQSENRHHLRFASTARFQRLSASAAEAVAIKPSVEAYSRINARVLLQKDAQEAAFKNLHRPRVLLLSTHGFFQKDPATASEGAEASTFGNPLLRCGLALSGCNNRAKAIEEETEDGILTGLEIVGTDLRGTELVVLSACETGLGDIHSGEGVAGLRQAFQLAGAQSVVSSLWQVEDGETARLMSDLFRNIADGMNKSEALRQAQLTRIQKRRERFGSAHPFFWAAFTLTGQQ